MDIRSGTTGEVRLSGSLTIRRVAELRDVLLASVASHHSIILDIDDEAEADISFVQLVLAAEASARAAGKQLRLKAPCAGTLRDVVDRAGFLRADKTGLWDAGGPLQ